MVTNTSIRDNHHNQFYWSTTFVYIFLNLIIEKYIIFYHCAILQWLSSYYVFIVVVRDFLGKKVIFTIYFRHCRKDDKLAESQ